MKIVVIGDGKVGHRVVMNLAKEGDDDVVLIDQSENKIKRSTNEMDIACIVGNGANAEVLKQAGVPDADLVIACASTDELNMICCLLAKRLGAKQTIARVRSPLYYQQMVLLKDDLQLSMAVNPDLTLAEEISRVIIFPSAAKIETFAKGRVEMMEMVLSEQSRFRDISLLEFYKKYQIKVLVCAVQRGEHVYIPDGSFVLKAGDKIYITASHPQIERFFRTSGTMRNKVHTVLICGGGLTAYYLASRLCPMGMNVKIIEKNPERCNELCDLLPKATIINGDASNQALLEEEGIEYADAFVALTGIDEENIIMGMYAKTKNISKVVAKVNESALREMAGTMGIETSLSAKESTVDVILSYVRAMKNSMGSANIETVYRVIKDKVEALEFYIREKTEYTDVPLKDLHIKENHLIACIVRGNEIIIPGGNDVMKENDSVIIICKGKSMKRLEDMFV